MSGNEFTAALLAALITRAAEDAAKANGIPLPTTVFITPIDGGYRADISITFSHAIADQLAGADNT